MSNEAVSDRGLVPHPRPYLKKPSSSPLKNRRDLNGDPHRVIWENCEETHIPVYCKRLLNGFHRGDNCFTYTVIFHRGDPRHRLNFTTNPRVSENDLLNYITFSNPLSKHIQNINNHKVKLNSGR